MKKYGIIILIVIGSISFLSNCNSGGFDYSSLPLSGSLVKNPSEPPDNPPEPPDPPDPPPLPDPEDPPDPPIPQPPTPRTGYDGLASVTATDGEYTDMV